MVFDAEALHELAGVDPRARRPPADPRPTARREPVPARRRRATMARLPEAGLATIPALVEEIDDDTALEISIIENLQREDLSPLEEAAMFDRMVHEHGYSIRKLADKLGKDKGYLENRLRLADAPEEIRELVSLRKDTALPRLRAAEGRGPEEASEAGRPGRLRRAVAGQAPGEDRGTAARARGVDELPIGRDGRATSRRRPTTRRTTVTGRPAGRSVPSRTTRSSNARHQLNDAVEDLVAVLRSPDVVRSLPEVDRANLAKYLTIAKLKLENAIAVDPVRRRRASRDPTPSDTREAGATGAGFVVSGDRPRWRAERLRSDGSARPRGRCYLFFDFPCVAVVAAPDVSWPWFCLRDASGPTRRDCRSRPACRPGRPRSRACRGCPGARPSAASASAASGIRRSSVSGVSASGVSASSAPRSPSAPRPPRPARSASPCPADGLGWLARGIGWELRPARATPADRARTARAIRRLRRRRLREPTMVGTSSTGAIGCPRLRCDAHDNDRGADRLGGRSYLVRSVLDVHGPSSADAQATPAPRSPPAPPSATASRRQAHSRRLAGRPVRGDQRRGDRRRDRRRASPATPAIGTTAASTADPTAIATTTRHEQGAAAGVARPGPEPGRDRRPACRLVPLDVHEAVADRQGGAGERRRRDERGERRRQRCRSRRASRRRAGSGSRPRTAATTRPSPSGAGRRRGRSRSRRGTGPARARLTEAARSHPATNSATAAARAAPRSRRDRPGSACRPSDPRRAARRRGR